MAPHDVLAKIHALGATSLEGELVSLEPRGTRSNDQRIRTLADILLDELETGFATEALVLSTEVRFTLGGDLAQRLDV
jgi:hypothetical protein